MREIKGAAKSSRGRGTPLVSRRGSRSRSGRSTLAGHVEGDRPNADPFDRRKRVRDPVDDPGAHACACADRMRGPMVPYTGAEADIPRPLRASRRPSPSERPSTRRRRARVDIRETWPPSTFRPSMPAPDGAGQSLTWTDNSGQYRTAPMVPAPLRGNRAPGLGRRCHEGPVAAAAHQRRADRMRGGSFGLAPANRPHPPGLIHFIFVM